MNRWRFLCGLFGAGAAAQQCVPSSGKINCNNECPVCRHRVKPWKVGDGDRILTHPPVQEGNWMTLALPDAQLIRCPRCNAAFWQDPEAS